jgi:hypothetical protein
LTGVEEATTENDAGPVGRAETFECTGGVASIAM